MINLLPQQQKEELLAEEKLKIILILGITITAFLISLTMIFYLLKNSVATELEVQKIYYTQMEQEMENPELKTAEEEVKNYNTLFSRIITFYQKRKKLTEFIEIISKNMPSGTYFSTFNVNPTNLEISLVGYCPSRDLLLEFKKNLEQTGIFKEVLFPTSNWIKLTDINFTITLKAKE